MSDYKSTIFLPKTPFSMKANLSKLEPQIIEKWKKNKLYETLRKKRTEKEKVILHWGPPYANGNLHIGHAFNGILKDIITRCYSMLDKDAPLVPGWDCHGLPIEWKIEEQYRKKGKRKEEINNAEFRQKCREFADKWLKVQSKEFDRLCICSDTDNPYITMDFSSESSIVKEFLTFVENGYVYQGSRPIMWSPIEKTALAEAEIEYKNKESTAIYVSFPVIKSNLNYLEDASFVIWTTTPWTIPGNRAVAFGSDIEYALISVKKVTNSNVKIGDNFVIACDLLDVFCQTIKIDEYSIIHKFIGDDLKGTVCAHPFKEQGFLFDVPLICGEHVTTESGTGLVHTAPGHGPDDFLLGKKYNLEIADVIDDNGVYASSVPHFSGIHVFKADDHVITLLKNSNKLLFSSKLNHSYPHSWRSKAPLIYRTTAQWFINIDHDNLRTKALNAIKETSWLPKSGINRINGMVADRPDWCVSRQRSWGVPLAIFVCKNTGQLLIDSKVNARIISAIKQNGCDAWFNNCPDQFLQPEYSKDDFIQVNDILDVWFDSGSTQGFVLESRSELTRPADIYLEGSDQHRGWFQSSLLVGCGTRGNAPFKKVITHGFTVDESGRKMSKSLGNVISPLEIADEMGAEILRLWVVSCDYTDDLKFGKNILKYQQDIYRRYRNTIRYLLGALSDFDSEKEILYDNLPILEKWILYKLAEIQKLFVDCVEQVDFQNFYSALHSFCNNDLSAFYFDIRKDTLYCDDRNGNTRLSALMVMNHVFLYLIKWLSPVLPVTTEEAFEIYKTTIGIDQHNTESIHLSVIDSCNKDWDNIEINKQFEKIKKYRSLINGALEQSRKNGVIGSSLQAKITIYDSENKLDRSIDFIELLIVSQIEIINTRYKGNKGFQCDNIHIIVEKAEDKKCERCWKILPEIGKNKNYNDLCDRCITVVEQECA